MFRSSDIMKTENGYSLTISTLQGSLLARQDIPISRCIYYSGGAKGHIDAQVRLAGGSSVLLDFKCRSMPIPISELHDSLLPEALERIKLLWNALKSCNQDELPLKNGMLPLYSIYFTEDGVIILSEQLTDAIRFCLDDDDNFEQTIALSWIKSPQGAALENEMVQLLYFAQTGILPFADPMVRGTSQSRFLRLSNTKADKSLAAIIDSYLEKRRGASLDNLLDSISWKPDAGSGVRPPDGDLMDTDEMRAQRARLEKLYKKALFWKKRGFIVGLAAVIVITIGYFTGNYLIKEFGPPQSAGLSQKEIIAYYYDAQTSLDVERLTDTLVHGVSSPVFNEVTALRVTQAARLGYEGFDFVMPPQQWLSSEQGPLLKGTIIYGVSDLSTMRIDEDSILATSILYAPYSYLEEEQEEYELDSQEPQSLTVYVYRQIQRFDFIQKRSWLEISGISTESLTLIDSFEVPYVERTRPF